MTVIVQFKPKKPRRFSHHPESGYTVRGKLYIEKDGELYLGRGRVILLERIDKLGSIAAAARSMQLGYRNAWLWVEATNRLASAPLVEKTVGGKSGGGARLTEEGRRTVVHYRELWNKFTNLLEQMQ